MLPLLKAIPVVSGLLDLVMKGYDWWEGKDKPNQVVLSESNVKICYDTNTLEGDQIAVVVAIFNRVGSMTQCEKTAHLNELFGFNKSTTTYRKIWKANKEVG
ncbi:MAG: hypothetical protein HRU18_02980 [Pseudoalteromonas sp.]|uniref:hypothetical protein n=1 Tax=Pseudoalteromonas sp. TaxID=53249 RepID=UPI001D3286CE|nr:hypothetical protein [Pseudoalteromonas sp.]NRA77149.1 hypothetical protein [Pseudoalteromonas sp.]